MLGKWVKMLLVSGIVTGLCASAQANTTNTPENPLAVETPALPVSRIALLLPGRSGIFGAAADAVRTGFLTAHERDKQGATVNLIESGDTPAEMLKAYVAALDDNDIIVGPLSRNGAAAIARS